MILLLLSNKLMQSSSSIRTSSQRTLAGIISILLCLHWINSSNQSLGSTFYQTVNLLAIYAIEWDSCTICVVCIREWDSCTICVVCIREWDSCTICVVCIREWDSCTICVVCIWCHGCHAQQLLTHRTHAAYSTTTRNSLCNCFLTWHNQKRDAKNFVMWNLE